jgi:hypothetical protein
MEKLKMAKEKAEATQTVAPEQPQAPAMQDPVSITVTDLQALVNLIDVASSRGAFRGPELTAVGTLYSKLAAFLQQITDTSVEQQAAETAPIEASAEEGGK